MRSKFRGGPAIIITAAFIGPGTITLCVLAGVQNGFSLAVGHAAFYLHNHCYSKYYRTNKLHYTHGFGRKFIASNIKSDS